MTTKKTMTLLLAALGASACTIKDRDYTGATVQVELTDVDGDTISDSDPDAVFTLEGGDPDYSISIVIATSGAMEDDGTNVTDAVVTTVTATFTLGGQKLTTPALSNDGDELDPTFRSSSPLSIPASAKGQTLTVEVTGVDTNGLSSNDDKFNVSLM